MVFRSFSAEGIDNLGGRGNKRRVTPGARVITISKRLIYIYFCGGANVTSRQSDVTDRLRCYIGL